MRTIVIYIFLCCTSFEVQAQNADTVAYREEQQFKLKKIIIPAALITFGAISGNDGDGIDIFNQELKEEVGEHIDQKITIDDFSQYAPMVAVYGLNLMGARGRNRFKERTIILATSYLIMGTSVGILKSATHIKRPDGSSNNSFPSGHTATAFMGAEFLWQEYKTTSIWYGIAGYTVAAGTGMFRVYNNRHWLTDVAAGAGIGMLSTKISYWLQPFIQNKVLKMNKKKTTAMFAPYFNGTQSGFYLTATF